MEPSQHDIDPLISRCREGDRSAQFQVYKRYHKAMYNVALRIVQHPATAEDAMQEAFLRAFTRLDSFKGEVAFGAWLKRIVINESLDQLKKAGRRNETGLEPVLYKTEDASIGYEDAEPGDRIQHLRAAMQQLKENYRLVLTLLYIEGYDQEEIQGILNITAGNCRTLISRAKESLRNKMQWAS